MVERRIREGIEAGEFDHLAGAGSPLPGAGTPDDDMWWIRGWLERNDLDWPGPPHDCEKSPND